MSRFRAVAPTLAALVILIVMPTTVGATTKIDPKTGHGGSLHGLACPTAKFCAAGGAVSEFGFNSAPATGNPLFASHASGAWNVDASMPKTSLPNSVTGISCVSASHCVAITRTDNGSTVSAHSAVWNGTAWHKHNMAQLGGGLNTDPGGVACVRISWCMAVGTYVDSSNGSNVLFSQLWNGSSWAPISVVEPTNQDNVEFNSVSCTSAAFCIAVGWWHDARHSGPAGAEPLAEQWNGSAWALMTPFADGNPNHATLYSVSCFNGNECMMVGGGVPGANPATPTAQLWNGNTKLWTEYFPVNMPGTASTIFSSVKCRSITFCMAVGMSATSTTTVAENGNAAETFNGTTWTPTAAPKTPKGAMSGQTALNAVDCASASSCEAVGSFMMSKDRIEVQHWNGSSWKLQIPTA